MDVTMKDFYKTQESSIHTDMLESRKQFEKQPYLGTVMRDGFRSFLPPDSKWQGHMIVSGPSVADEIQQASNTM
jgi:hypothetical protein